MGEEQNEELLLLPQLLDLWLPNVAIGDVQKSFNQKLRKANDMPPTSEIAQPFSVFCRQTESGRSVTWSDGSRTRRRGLYEDQHLNVARMLSVRAHIEVLAKDSSP